MVGQFLIVSHFCLFRSGVTFPRGKKEEEEAKGMGIPISFLGTYQLPSFSSIVSGNVSSTPNL